MLSTKKLLYKICERIRPAERFVCSPNSSSTTGWAIGFYDHTSRTVRIIYYCFSTSNLPADIFTIPSAYRPSATVGGCAVNCTDQTTFCYDVYLNTNGAITPRGSSYIRSTMGVFEYTI